MLHKHLKIGKELFFYVCANEGKINSEQTIKIRKKKNDIIREEKKTKKI